MAIPYVLKSNSTNKIDYDLGYTQTFADSSSNLNVTGTNYNIVPAKKIYDYVQNAISSLSSGSSFDIYNNSVNFNVTHSTGTGYFYYNINLLDNNTDYTGKMHMFIDQNIKITNTTDNTGEEDLNSCRLALDPLDAGGFVLQIGHNFINGKNYNISGSVFYALINANERSNISKSINYLSNQSQAIKDKNSDKNYYFPTVPLIMQFEDVNTEWKTFDSSVVLEPVKENIYWCTVKLCISDTFPTNREKETIIKIPFNFATVPSYTSSHGILRFTVQGYSHNSLHVMQRIANHTNGNSTQWVYLMLPSAYNDTVWIAPKGWPSNFNQGMAFTIDGSFRYLCDITTNNYDLML